MQRGSDDLAEIALLVGDKPRRHALRRQVLRLYFCRHVLAFL